MTVVANRSSACKKTGTIARKRRTFVITTVLSDIRQTMLSRNVKQCMKIVRVNLSPKPQRNNQSVKLLHCQ